MYKIIYEDLQDKEVYEAEVYGHDTARRVVIKQENTKCHLVEGNGRILITVNKKNIELDYEEAKLVLMGLLAEGFDVGVDVSIENV